MEPGSDFRSRAGIFKSLISFSPTYKSDLKAVIFLATKQGSGKRPGIKGIAEQMKADEHAVGKIGQAVKAGGYQ